jgi:hypothetical protein
MAPSVNLGAVFDLVRTWRLEPGVLYLVCALGVLCSFSISH